MDNPQQQYHPYHHDCPCRLNALLYQLEKTLARASCGERRGPKPRTMTRWPTRGKADQRNASVNIGTKEGLVCRLRSEEQ